MAKLRNIGGQVTRKEPISKKMTKTLKDIAYEYEIRLGALLRDELASTLQQEIYNSYTPTSTGDYEHTRTLVTAVYATIEGDVVQAKVSENKTYPAVEIDENGNEVETTKTARQIYDYLKFGTKAKEPDSVYPYIDENGNVSYAPYVQTPAHNFEARTNKRMNELIDKIKSNPELYLKPYLNKYRNLRMKYKD